MNAIEIRNVSKYYPDFAIQDLNLTLPGGCILGLIGENGAGKSTTIKLILDMLHAQSGTITVLGKDSRADSRLLKEDIGVVLDEVGLPECLNAVQVGKIMAYTFRNWDAAEYARLCRQLSIPENKDFKDMSRGMKMKLGIAAAMSHHAKLLLLDEATSGLDPVVRDEVLELLRSFVCDGDHAILISSHIVSDLEKLCDYVAFLHKGKLMLCAEKDDLLAQYGIVHCGQQELETIRADVILHKKVNAYGAEAIVRRSAIPAAMAVSPVSVEELFIYMVKEAR